MKNTATLPQVMKILSLLEGISSDQVQKVIESGFFLKGELDALARKVEAKRFQEAWQLIGTLTGFKDISITVPHVPYQYAESDKNAFQLRCWQGEHGHSGTAGHVDSGSAKGKLLFETRISERLNECSCCWRSQLQCLGLNFDFNSNECEWICENKGNYDIIKLRVHEQ